MSCVRYLSKTLTPNASHAQKLSGRLDPARTGLEAPLRRSSSGEVGENVVGLYLMQT